MKKTNGIDKLLFFIIVLLIVITATGLLSFNTRNSYIIINQYGDEVRIFGSGIYAHDSYFKAPIFVGTDFTMLLLAVPMMTISLIGDVRRQTQKSKLKLTAVTAVVLYYTASIAFGVTYNAYHLLYIALFSCSLFALITLITQFDTGALQRSLCIDLPTKGMRVFLILSGVSLFVAWLPDIIPTLISRTTLPHIEVYTTEITYVLDMGIISPLMFICLVLLKKKKGLGIVILSAMLTLCTIVGVMLPIQTVFQVLAGIDIPAPVLITKVGTFVVLAVFAAAFNFRLMKSIVD